jgi:SAM-dependent methyltransferase
MSGFSTGWLAMREPYDRAARNGAVLDAVAAAFADAPAAAVADLGCGTGATMRAIAPRLPARQCWLLVDSDKDLLTAAACAAPAGVSVTTVTADLADADLATAAEQMLGDCDLVATSALLDLVSAAWLDRLVAALSRRARPFYAALSYDGAVRLSPESRYDGEVIAAVNRHQRTNKGFGPALGPDAARTAPERLRAAGFTVIEGRSDWQFGVDDGAIQMEMLAGWGGAAGEIGVDPRIIARWLDERQEHVSAGRSQMRVGHIDFFATPDGAHLARHGGEHSGIISFAGFSAA